MLKTPKLKRIPHVVVFCQVFYPDSISTSQLFTDLLKGMDGKKIVLTVITSYPAMPNGVRLMKREMLGDVEIRRAGMKIDYKRGLFYRGLNYLCYLAGATIELWKLRECPLVFGVTCPPFTPVWLWFLSKVFLKRYQIMLLDIYPEGLVGIGKLNAGGLVARVWRAANRVALRSADRVLVLGRDMKELVESVYCVPRSCIDYVPHWSTFEPDEIIPAEKTEMVKKLMLEKKFLVQYSGNMGLWHDIDSVVEAAADLKDHPDIHFIMIGDGMRRAHAQLRADQFQLQNMTWLPFQPRETLADSLSCCHIALISQREGLKGVAVPCKLYGILASGRGIVAMVPAQSEIDLVVHEEECGQTISPGDIGGLVSAILQLKGKPSLVARMGENAFRAYHQKYTLKTAITKFQNIWIKNLEYEEKASSFG